MMGSVGGSGVGDVAAWVVVPRVVATGVVTVGGTDVVGCVTLMGLLEELAPSSEFDRTTPAEIPPAVATATMIKPMS